MFDLFGAFSRKITVPMSDFKAFVRWPILWCFLELCYFLGVSFANHGLSIAVFAVVFEYYLGSCLILELVARGPFSLLRV